MKTRLQYSLGTMLVSITIAAVVFWAQFVLPEPFVVVLLWALSLLVTSGTIAIIVYGRGSVRAFAIGCVPPLVSWWLISGLGTGVLSPGSVNATWLFPIVVIALMSGSMSVIIRNNWLRDEG